jgi:hypothetical protein
MNDNNLVNNGNRNEHEEPNPTIVPKLWYWRKLVIPRALGTGNTSGFGLPLAMCAVFVL